MGLRTVHDDVSLYDLNDAGALSSVGVLQHSTSYCNQLFNQWKGQWYLPLAAQRSGAMQYLGSN